MSGKYLKPEDGTVYVLNRSPDPRLPHVWRNSFTGSTFSATRAEMDARPWWRKLFVMRPK